MIADPSFIQGQLLRIFVGEDAQYHGQPLHLAIIELLKREGIAGASAFRGVEGFGSHHEIHLNRVFAVGGRLPILIEVVDGERRIAALLPRLEEMIDEGAVTLERVEYRRFTPTR